MKQSMNFSEFVEINPKVPIQKAVEYPFVAMEDVIPGCRYVSAKTKRLYKGGGAKFQAGDVLFARITPCLENGKIAQFLALPGRVGFGSTEFFVFRHREGVSDPAYVFYLAYTDTIRKPAEKSMSGASGRQRADLASIRDVDVPASPLPTQHKIAAILSAYDDLIENNLRRIEILEQSAKTIYHEWFVNLRFLGHENVEMAESEQGPIPEGWDVSTLGDVCHIVMGQSPKSEFYNTNGDGLPFHQGVTDFGTLFPTDRIYCTVQNRVAEKGDILFSVRAPVGRINIANKRIVIGRGLSAIRSQSGQQWFVFHQLKEKFREEDTMGGGTVFNAVTKQDMHRIKVIVPQQSILEQFEEVVRPVFSQLETLTDTNDNLRRTRDMLLPKLISSELDVEDLDIDTGGLVR